MHISAFFNAEVREGYRAAKQLDTLFILYQAELFRILRCHKINLRQQRKE